MKNYILAACLFVGTFAFTACDTGSNNNQQERDTAASTADGVVADTTLTEEKKEFMAFAAKANMLQKDLGMVAVERAQTDHARVYGQKMVDLYTGKQNELRELARNYSVTLPQVADDDHLKRVQDLQNKKPSEFDMAYLDEAVNAHQSAIKEYDDNIKDYEETQNKLFNIWSRNTQLEKQAQMEEAMRLRQDLKNRR